MDFKQKVHLCVKMPLRTRNEPYPALSADGKEYCTYHEKIPLFKPVYSISHFAVTLISKHMCLSK